MTASAQSAKATSTKPSLRRIPKQARSRARYDAVLTAAHSLIAERGNDAVSMREIADAASVPVSSIYQYFPDKNALLWALISDFLESFEAQWATLIAGADSLAALDAATEQAFALMLDMCAADPAITRIWTSVQANAVLSELDQASNRRLAKSFTTRLKQLAPATNEHRAYTRTLLMCTFASATASLIFSGEVDRGDAQDAFRDFARTAAAG